MNTAAKVRAEKEAHPDRFCPDRRCLWRVDTRDGVRPCQRHMVPRETRAERIKHMSSTPGAIITVTPSGSLEVRGDAEARIRAVERIFVACGIVGGTVMVRDVAS